MRLAIAAVVAVPAAALARDRVADGAPRLAMLEGSATPEVVLTVSTGFYQRALLRDAALGRVGVLPVPEPPGSWDPARVEPAYVSPQGRPVGGYLWARSEE